MENGFGNPMIVAHRGASAKYPENSMSAIRGAWNLGADAVEIDVRLTKDKKIICIHDPDTKRVSDRKLKVAKVEWDSLSSLDVGSWKGDEWRGESIPLLRDVLVEMPPEKELFVEIKGGEEMCDLIDTLLIELSVQRSSIKVLSFDEAVIQRMESISPDYYTILLLPLKRSRLTKDWRIAPRLICKRLTEIGADGLSFQMYQKVDEVFVNEITSQGFECHTWGIRGETYFEKAKTLGIRSVTTDFPGRVKSLRDLE